MEPDPSDFLSSSSRVHTAGTIGRMLLRRSWGVLLPMAALLPAGVSVVSHNVQESKTPTSYSQAMAEEEESTEDQTPEESATTPDPSSTSEPVTTLASQIPVEESSDSPQLADLLAQVAEQQAKLEELRAEGSNLVPEEEGESAQLEESALQEVAGLPSGSSVVHVVKPGDTLSEIAQKYGVPSSQIARANGRGVDDVIRVGERLSIPLPGEEGERPFVLEPVGPRKVRVQPGDSLYSLGRNHGVSAEEIAQVNGIDPNDPIHPGQVLTIPAPGTTPILKPIPPAGTAASSPPVTEPVSGLPAPGEPVEEVPREVILGPPAPAPYESSSDYEQAEVHSYPPSTTSNYPNDADYIPVATPTEETGETGTQPIYRARRYHGSSTSGGGSYGTGATGAVPPGSGAPYSYSPTETGMISYVVQPYDTFASIARAHSTTSEVIMKVNGIRTIKQGQTIMLPIHQTKMASSPGQSR